MNFEVSNEMIEQMVQKEVQKQVTNWFNRVDNKKIIEEKIKEAVKENVDFVLYREQLNIQSIATNIGNELVAKKCGEELSRMISNALEDYNHQW